MIIVIVVNKAIIMGAVVALMVRKSDWKPEGWILNTDRKRLSCPLSKAPNPELDHK